MKVNNLNNLGRKVLLEAFPAYAAAKDQFLLPQVFIDRSGGLIGIEKEAVEESWTLIDLIEAKIPFLQTPIKKVNANSFMITGGEDINSIFLSQYVSTEAIRLTYGTTFLIASS